LDHPTEAKGIEAWIVSGHPLAKNGHDDCEANKRCRDLGRHEQETFVL